MAPHFHKPTVEELAAYAAGIGYATFDAGRFFDHYEMVGWVVGKARTPMKCWRAAVRTWQRNEATWSGRPAVRGAETDPTVLEYARQVRINKLAGGYEIGSLYRKIRDVIGQDGLERVKLAVAQIQAKEELGELR